MIQTKYKRREWELFQRNSILASFVVSVANVFLIVLFPDVAGSISPFALFRGFVDCALFRNASGNRTSFPSAKYVV
jgi:hypothetical protein